MWELAQNSWLSNQWYKYSLSDKVSGIGSTLLFPISKFYLKRRLITWRNKDVDLHLVADKCGQLLTEPLSHSVFFYPLDYTALKSVRPHLGRPSFNSPTKSTPRLMPLPPPAHPIHGRVDWSAKYGAHRWCAEIPSELGHVSHQMMDSMRQFDILLCVPVYLKETEYEWDILKGFFNFTFICINLNAILYLFV